MAMRARRVGGWLNLVLSGLLALAVWGLVTVLATQPALKKLWDVSPQARFSVEPATEELLQQIRGRGEHVEIHTVFYPLQSITPTTDEQRQHLAIEQRLQDLTRDLLRQYAYLGGDAVTVTHHDLLRDPAQVREVMRAVQNGRYNSVIVKVGKRSAVLQLDIDLAEIDLPEPTPGMPGQRRVPVLRDYKGEEAISTAIKRLLVEGSPVIYFAQGFGGLRLEAVAHSYSEMLQSLTDDGFEVRFFDLDKASSVPEDAAVVAIVNPTREIPPQVADVLERYVRSGGRLFVNPIFYEDPRDWNVRLRELGERFGFELSDELVCHVIADPNNPRGAITGTPQCQNLIAVNLNQVHPVTRPLVLQQRYPRFKIGREIRAIEATREGVRVDTSFLRTGPGAWLQPSPVEPYVGPADPSAYTSRCIGAVIDVDADSGDRDGHVVVIAAEGFDNATFQFNGDLALNLFNWMTQREALISIRGQRYVSHKLELAPQQLGRIGWLLMGFVPGGMLLLGLFVFWRRSRS